MISAIFDIGQFPYDIDNGYFWSFYDRDYRYRSYSILWTLETFDIGHFRYRSIQFIQLGCPIFGNFPYWSDMKKDTPDSDSEDEINRGLSGWDEDILVYCRPMYKNYLFIIDAIIDQILYYRRVYQTNYFQSFNFHGGIGSSRNTTGRMWCE